MEYRIRSGTLVVSDTLGMLMMSVGEINLVNVRGAPNGASTRDEVLAPYWPYLTRVSLGYAAHR